MWGAESLAGTITTRYLQPSYSSDAAPTTAAKVQIKIPAGITSFDAVRMTIFHNYPAGNGNDIVYTLRINGTPTALAVTLASTGVSAEATATVAISADDLLDIEITKALGVGAGPSGIICLVEAAP